jgi:virulence-associated protein VagC
VSDSEQSAGMASVTVENGQQVLRLAGDVAFPAEVRRVRILRDGHRRIIVPADSGWDWLYDRRTAPGGSVPGLAIDLGKAVLAGARRLLARREWWREVLLAIVVAMSAMFVIRARVGLTTLDFGDESEKYVAVQMMRQGRTLYGDIYANHGPLAYILAWSESLLFGTQDFSLHRLVVLLLAAAAVALIVISARLWAVRLTVAVLFVAPLSAMWFVHPMHMLLYPALDGYLVTMMLALLVLPAIAGRNVGRWAARGAGACFMLAFAAAYPAGLPATLCLTAAACSLAFTHGRHAAGRMVLQVALGAAVTSLPLVLWMSLYANWPGYFAYHFYLNQVVYGRMTAFSPLKFLQALRLSVDPASRAHAFAIVAGGTGLIALLASVAVARGRGALARGVAVAPVALALLMLNFNGSSEFPDAGQMIGCFAVFAAGLGAALAVWPRSSPAAMVMLCAAGILVSEFTARTALMSPYTIPRAQAFQRLIAPQPADPLFDAVRRAVPPGETMLAMPFWPGAYINAERLPASGQYYYLPFQAEYDRAPILGAAIDFCGDITRNRPRIILLMGAKPGSAGDLLTYKPCFAALLARDYDGQPEFGLFENQPILYRRRDTSAP